MAKNGDADFFCADGVEVMLFEAAVRSLSFEDCIPVFAAFVFEAIGLHAAFSFFENGDQRYLFFALQIHFPPWGVYGGMGGPGGGEIVVAGEIADAVVVTPAAFGGTVLGEVATDDGDLAGWDRLCGACMLPELAYLAKCFDGIVVHQAFSIRGYVEHEVAVGLIVGADVFLDEPSYVLEFVCRHGFLPEPGALYAQAGHCGEVVFAGVYLLPGALFIRFDVGVEQCLAGILGCIEVHDEAVGLQALDVFVDFLEWYFFVGNA